MEWILPNNNGATAVTRLNVPTIESLAGEHGRKLLEEWIDSLLVAEGRRFIEEVPRASHLTDDMPLDLRYYLRHRIEAIWRIWLTARIDAIALSHLVTEDYEAARKWARYAADELDHDRMFLADLAHHGLTEDYVRSVVPFGSTAAMVKEIERDMLTYGSLPALAYSLFVEWNAERFSAKTVRKAEALLSAQHVAGARRHADFDVAERHLPMILDITFRLLIKVRPYQRT